MDMDDAEYNALNQQVNANSDSFEAWEKLVSYVDSLEGGINKNSSPGAIAAFRDTYNRLLARFPLFYLYWIKYAQAEFAIVGTEAAELVYERGVASISNSIDLWLKYLDFKSQTCHNSDENRRLYERAAECIGLDFMSHPFWNRYIEYENRLEQHDRVFAILMRLIHLPLYSYANYFERFRQQSLARPLQDRVPADVFEQWRRELEHHAKSIGQPAESMDEVLQQRTEFYINERYGEISSAVQERWKFEENIKQPFFHVTDVAEPELANWRKYLVFEEQQGNFERIVTLYERCLVTTAQYEEFWLRYVRWMRGQSNESEAVRHILMRASSAFVPVALPAVRLQWALYEEASGRFEIAEDIYSEFLKNSPGHLEVIRAWANAVRRQKGIDDAAGMIREQLRVTELEQETKALMLAELARIYSARSVAEGRQVFEDSKNRNMDVKEFWAEYLLYEIKHTKLESDTKDSPARGVCNEITRTSHLDEQSKNQLVNMYMEHLLESSDSKAATEWLAIDSTANKGAAV